MGVLSFNANKIITTGSGGAILTSNPVLAKRARYLTTQAKDDPIYFVHNDIGYNYRMSNISAALGLSQIKQIKFFLKKKKLIREFYFSRLEKVENLQLAKTPEYSKNNNWLNILKINNKFKYSRDRLINNMIKNNISVRPVWKLNHLQKPFKKFQQYKIKNAINLVKYSLCLPSSPSLTKRELKKIIYQLNV